MINGQSIKGLVESVGLEETCTRLGELIETNQVRAEDFNLQELAVAFCGYEWVRRLNPQTNARFKSLALQEAGEGVDVTAFNQITGQIVFSKINQGWEQVGMIGDQFFETVPTLFQGERIPGVGRLPSEGELIRPGMPYPEAGFGQHWWDTPATTKQGEIVSLTKEAIFFDRTGGLILRRAQEIGKRLRYRKEAKQLACIAGITVSLGAESFNGNNHKWDGTSYNSYATGANAIGINSVSGVTLTDWTSIQTLDLLFAALTDPDTGLPILVNANTLLVMKDNLYTARRIARATDVRTTSPGFATNAIVQQTSAASPLDPLNVVYSPYLKQLSVASGVTAANAANWWFLIEPKKGLWYMENWPFQVIQAPANSIKEFEQDLDMRWKASEMGVPAVVDPRYQAKAYNS